MRSVRRTQGQGIRVVTKAAIKERQLPSGFVPQSWYVANMPALSKRPNPDLFSLSRTAALAYHNAQQEASAFREEFDPSSFVDLTQPNYEIIQKVGLAHTPA